MCSATSRMQPPRSRFVFNLTIRIHGNQTFVGIHTHKENVTLIVSMFLFHSIKDAIIAPEHEISIYLCFYHSLREDLLNSERGVIPIVCLIGWSRLVSIKKKKSDAFSFYNFASWTNCRSKWWLNERWDKWWRSRKKARRQANRHDFSWMDGAPTGRLRLAERGEAVSTGVSLHKDIRRHTPTVAAY